MKKFLYITAVILLIVLLSACDTSNVQVGNGMTASPAPTDSVTVPADSVVAPTPTDGEEEKTEIVMPDAPDIDTDTVKAVFVDSKTGDDRNSGTKDKPVKTLQKAKELIRTMNRNMTEDLYVFLREGVYEQSQTLIFTPDDSGTSGKRIIWRSYPGEKAVISGGVSVEGWILHDAEKNIWKAPANGVVTRDLYVNGKRADRAAQNKDAIKYKASFYNDGTAVAGILVNDASLLSLTNVGNIEMVFDVGFQSNRIRLESITEHEGKALLTFVKPAWTSYISLYSNLTQKWHIGYLENAYELLDTPGEWYLNQGEDTVYYMPREGDDMSKAEAVFGVLENVMKLEGEINRNIENLTFTGLTFSNSTWMQASQEEGLLIHQANVYFRKNVTGETWPQSTMRLNPVSAVEGIYLRNIEFSHNRFVNLGSGGLMLGTATKNALVSYNYAYDCAGTGIMVGGVHDKDAHNNEVMGQRNQSIGNAVSDNYIDNVASVYKSGVGLLVGYVKNTVIEHNTIVNLPYTGISYSWGWINWNKPDKYHTDNIIRNNYIYNVMNELVDGGGIYTLGKNDNTLIESNYIGRVNNDYGGIYLDDGSWGITVKNNVLDQCYRNYIYKGKNNLIKDNYCQKGAGNMPDMPMMHEPYTFENNYMWDEAKVAEIKNNAGVRVTK